MQKPKRCVQLAGVLAIVPGLWALSVVAYECLTGALPFRAKTPDEWTRAVAQGRRILQ